MQESLLDPGKVQIQMKRQVQLKLRGQVGMTLAMAKDLMMYLN